MSENKTQVLDIYGARDPTPEEHLKGKPHFRLVIRECDTDSFSADFEKISADRLHRESWHDVNFQNNIEGNELAETLGAIIMNCLGWPSWYISAPEIIRCEPGDSNPNIHSCEVKYRLSSSCSSEHGLVHFRITNIQMEDEYHSSSEDEKYHYFTVIEVATKDCFGVSTWTQVRTGSSISSDPTSILAELAVTLLGMRFDGRLETWRQDMYRAELSPPPPPGGTFDSENGGYPTQMLFRSCKNLGQTPPEYYRIVRDPELIDTLRRELSTNPCAIDNDWTFDDTTGVDRTILVEMSAQ